MNRTISVVVVDDHPFFRDGLSRGLSASGRIRVVGEAADARSGIAAIGELQPDVAVVDYQMPGMTGIDLVHAVTRDGGATKVLLLSAVTDSVVVFDALREGAAGYMSKESDRDAIVGAVERVARGETVVPPELAAGLVTQIRAHAAPGAPTLSEREPGAQRFRAGSVHSADRRRALHRCVDGQDTCGQPLPEARCLRSRRRGRRGHAPAPHRMSR